jgi:hypothetical protein
MSRPLTLVLIMLALACEAQADFSRSHSTLHPEFPAKQPFIIALEGVWPSDCHPGEQKPVIESWDGQTAEIGFEIITVHITCNDSDTAYRVLIDMSAAVLATPPAGDTLDLQVDFDGAPFQQTLQLVCPEDQDCEGSTGQIPRVGPGLYFAPGLANQGLLVARQHLATALYPLVYDDQGRSEWLFTGNVMQEDAFFTEILRFSGGDCFGCEPTGAEPEMTAIGHISVLADGPDTLQVKIDDGLFVEYNALVYGYRVFALGPDGSRHLIDLEGRWGISENRGTDPPLGDLTRFIPGPFDIEFTGVVIAEEAADFAEQVTYSVKSPAGDVLGELVCDGQTAADGITNVCQFIDPTDAAEPLLLFFQQGPSTLAIEYGRAVIAIGTPPGGKAVRID